MPNSPNGLAAKMHPLNDSYCQLDLLSSEVTLICRSATEAGAIFSYFQM